MTDADKPYVAEVLNEFGILFGREVTKEMAAIYWKSLKEMDRLGFDYAVKRIMKTDKFFPLPSAFWQAERARWG